MTRWQYEQIRTVFARCARHRMTTTATGRTGRNSSVRRTSEDRKYHATHARRGSLLRRSARGMRRSGPRPCCQVSHSPLEGHAIAATRMKVTSGPYVPERFLCHCQVPVWVGVDNFWKGWGECVCLRCKKHGFWGMIWARLYPNTPRSKILKREGVTE